MTFALCICSIGPNEIDLILINGHYRRRGESKNHLNKFITRYAWLGYVHVALRTLISARTRTRHPKAIWTNGSHKLQLASFTQTLSPFTICSDLLLSSSMPSLLSPWIFHRRPSAAWDHTRFYIWLCNDNIAPCRIPQKHLLIKPHSQFSWRCGEHNFNLREWVCVCVCCHCRYCSDKKKLIDSEAECNKTFFAYAAVPLYDLITSIDKTQTAHQ